MIVSALLQEPRATSAFPLRKWFLHRHFATLHKVHLAAQSVLPRPRGRNRAADVSASGSPPSRAARQRLARNAGKVRILKTLFPERSSVMAPFCAAARQPQVTQKGCSVRPKR